MSKKLEELKREIKSIDKHIQFVKFVECQARIDEREKMEKEVKDRIENVEFTNIIRMNNPNNAMDKIKELFIEILELSSEDTK